ncbi:HNH endonuclease [Nocardioides sp. Leaf307]|uniref:HNH endonuclease n=1 Tax=Nocardioides sp. Leaf307 TaxID=1736331 RepID=UPI0009E82C70
MYVAVQSSRGSTYKKNRLTVLARDNYCCVYCGREATTADHVVAVANGGTDDVSNLVACCITCNSSKGKRINVRLNYYDARWLDSL